MYNNPIKITHILAHDNLSTWVDTIFIIWCNISLKYMSMNYFIYRFTHLFLFEYNSFNFKGAMTPF